MLIAHEDVFQRSYLQEVLAASGAMVAGALSDPAAVAARLEAEPRPDALVLSSMLPDRQAPVLARLAAERGVVVMAVEPARGGSHAALSADTILTGPYAGYQIVEAIAKLLAAREALTPGVSQALGR